MGCLFCKIVKKEIPATLVLDDPEVLAFRDINPVAPSHVLVIPKKHISGLDQVTSDDAALLGTVFVTARKVAEMEGLLSTGFRTVVNTGRDATQTVAHLHVHVIGKRLMQWPPG